MALLKLFPSQEKKTPKQKIKLESADPKIFGDFFIAQQSLPAKVDRYIPNVDISRKFEESIEIFRSPTLENLENIFDLTKNDGKNGLKRNLSSPNIDADKTAVLILDGQKSNKITRPRFTSESEKSIEDKKIKEERRASDLVDQLLMEIYGRNDVCKDCYRTETDCSVSSVKSYDSKNFTQKLHFEKLKTKDDKEITVLHESLKERVHFMGNILVKYLKKKDALKSKQEKLCNVITAHLQANSDKKSEDTTMRFSPNPPPNYASPDANSGFHQWVDAMRQVAKLPGGIPSDFRRRLWLALADRHLQTKATRWSKYEKLCFSDTTNPEDSELGVQIVKDLHRTGCSLFCGAAGRENQALLKRVLLAYARWNKQVGYCQGFNMLAALILQVMDRNETDSVKVMIYLIEGVLPESYFANNLRGLSVDMIVFRDLLKMRLPQLSRHLEALQNDARDGNSYEPPLTNVFTMQWFLTLFCNCLPQTTVLRVWDLIFLEGNEILLRTAIAIWERLSDRILAVNSADEFYSIMGVLTREMLEFGLVDSNTLIKSIVTIGVCTELNEMRDKYLYNITPWTQSVQSAAKKGFRLFYSDDDDIESDTEEKVAVAAAYGINMGRKKDKANSSSGGGSNAQVQPYAYGHPDRERLALDISALKKQYAKLRERQRQAHIILTAACARQPINQNTSPSPIAMNHLLLGKNAIVNAHGRRLGPPKGAVPPARTKTRPRDHKDHKDHKDNKEKDRKEAETLHWKDAPKVKIGRRISVDEQSNKTEDVYAETESSSYSEDDSSSTSTELCDEQERLQDFEEENTEFCKKLEEITDECKELGKITDDLIEIEDGTTKSNEDKNNEAIINLKSNQTNNIIPTKDILDLESHEHILNKPEIAEERLKIIDDNFQHYITEAINPTISLKDTLKLDSNTEENLLKFEEVKMEIPSQNLETNILESQTFQMDKMDQNLNLQPYTTETLNQTSVYLEPDSNMDIISEKLKGDPTEKFFLEPEDAIPDKSFPSPEEPKADIGIISRNEDNTSIEMKTSNILEDNRDQKFTIENENVPADNLETNELEDTTPKPISTALEISDCPKIEVEHVSEEILDKNQQPILELGGEDVWKPTFDTSPDIDITLSDDLDKIEQATGGKSIAEEIFDLENKKDQVESEDKKDNNTQANPEELQEPLKVPVAEVPDERLTEALETEPSEVKHVLPDLEPLPVPDSRAALQQTVAEEISNDVPDLGATQRKIELEKRRIEMEKILSDNNNLLIISSPKKATKGLDKVNLIEFTPNSSPKKESKIHKEMEEIISQNKNLLNSSPKKREPKEVEVLEEKTEEEVIPILVETSSGTKTEETKPDLNQSNILLLESSYLPSTSEEIQEQLTPDQNENIKDKDSELDSRISRNVEEFDRNSKTDQETSSELIKNQFCLDSNKEDTHFSFSTSDQFDNFVKISSTSLLETNDSLKTSNKIEDLPFDQESIRRDLSLTKRSVADDTFEDIGSFSSANSCFVSDLRTESGLSKGPQRDDFDQFMEERVKVLKKSGSGDTLSSQTLCSNEEPHATDINIEDLIEDISIDGDDFCQNPDLLSIEDKRLEAGRKNSERALKIIQENSMILDRILQHQSKSIDSEDKKEESPVRKAFTRSDSLPSEILERRKYLKSPQKSFDMTLPKCIKEVVDEDTNKMDHLDEDVIGIKNLDDDTKITLHSEKKDEKKEEYTIEEIKSKFESFRRSNTETLIKHGDKLSKLQSSQLRRSLNLEDLRKLYPEKSLSKSSKHASFEEFLSRAAAELHEFDLKQCQERAHRTLLRSTNLEDDSVNPKNEDRTSKEKLGKTSQSLDTCLDDLEKKIHEKTLLEDLRKEEGETKTEIGEGSSKISQPKNTDTEKSSFLCPEEPSDTFRRHSSTDCKQEPETEVQAPDRSFRRSLNLDDYDYNPDPILSKKQDTTNSSKKAETIQEFLSRTAWEIEEMEKREQKSQERKQRIFEDIQERKREEEENTSLDKKSLDRIGKDNSLYEEDDVDIATGSKLRSKQEHYLRAKEFSRSDLGASTLYRDEQGLEFSRKIRSGSPEVKNSTEEFSRGDSRNLEYSRGESDSLTKDENMARSQCPKSYDKFGTKRTFCKEEDYFESRSKYRSRSPDRPYSKTEEQSKYSKNRDGCAEYDDARTVEDSRRRPDNFRNKDSTTVEQSQTFEYSKNRDCSGEYEDGRNVEGTRRLPEDFRNKVSGREDICRREEASIIVEPSFEKEIEELFRKEISQEKYESYDSSKSTDDLFDDLDRQNRDRRRLIRSPEAYDYSFESRGSLDDVLKSPADDKYFYREKENRKHLEILPSPDISKSPEKRLVEDILRSPEESCCSTEDTSISSKFEDNNLPPKEKLPTFPRDRSNLSINLKSTTQISPDISPQNVTCLQFTSFQKDLPCSSNFPPCSSISNQSSSNSKSEMKPYSVNLPTLSPPRRGRSPLSPQKNFSPFPVQPTTRQPKDIGVKLGLYKDLSPLKTPPKW